MAMYERRKKHPISSCIGISQTVLISPHHKGAEETAVFAISNTIVLYAIGRIISAQYPGALLVHALRSLIMEYAGSSGRSHFRLTRLRAPEKEYNGQCINARLQKGTRSVGVVVLQTKRPVIDGCWCCCKVHPQVAAPT
jgi:hypothetical protein